MVGGRGMGCVDWKLGLFMFVRRHAAAQALLLIQETTDQVQAMFPVLLEPPGLYRFLPCAPRFRMPADAIFIVWLLLASHLS